MRAFYFTIILFTFAAGQTRSAEPIANEENIRQRFVASYTAAQTPEARTQAISLLKGVQEKESQRLLAGTLGDKNEIVQKTACETIARTPDKQGYFVKPLIGALMIGNNDVRAAAAAALSHAQIKADAVKALVYELLRVANLTGRTKRRRSWCRPTTWPSATWPISQQNRSPRAS
jgi:HEAT repeat protein